MSISVSKIVNLPQAALKFLVQEETEDDSAREYTTIGGVFSGTDYAWLSNGPRLEVVHTKTGSKVGAWTFGWVLKNSYTEVVCVDEIQRPHGRPPLLAVGIDCEFNGGMICIFDFITSKIIRAIQIKDKITKLHVIDAGHDVFTLPGPLRNFDGIIAVGTVGGDVFLVDICRQICDEALTTGGLSEIRDELNPCQLNNITSRDIHKIELHKEFAVRNSQHLAIHLNIVFDKSTKHFTLKGPKGEDRIHVNKDEVTVSALFYCPQLGSLLVGYNFGALQLYNLMNLELVYTSPVCEEHIPISHFAVQEPADDPRAFCYVWAIYSAAEEFSTTLPLAVMYAFCYHTKEYHEGYGFLYQDFNTASVHYQMELAVPENYTKKNKPKGGNFLKLNSISHGSMNKEGPPCESSEDNLTLCVLVWNVWFSNKESDTFVAIFDLNQWYKEQMPSVPDAQYSSSYMLQISIGSLIDSATNKSLPVIDIHIDQNSIQQYCGAQRLEEHFCPNSISFSVCSLRENDIVHLHNSGVQKALLAQIESSGPLCLVEPAEIYQEVVCLGLTPLFIDLPSNTPITTNQQREIILSTALENQLMGWLCKCASEWANGSFLSTGCSLDFLICWAFQRAVTLKTNCDNFCTSLFDYSEVRLDNNTNLLLNSCTRQLKNLCSLYAYIVRKLYMFISNQELVDEQFKSLQTTTVYFEVLQWLLNVGLLPECPLSAYPRSDDLERISAPYPAEMLIDFYNHRRAILKILNEENFSSSASVLFIDNLIERECGGNTLQEQWRSDGGNGLYPPPSLQALLRTYLVDNVELPYKHSVIIYVFLDLAMTLEQDKYKPVITHLIKFPAVFKVSPSLIKITQAFWQLDHGDYNTAMGLLLDPLVLNEDLSQWHHKVALRSLMLQKQHNYALLYVQVRKPILTDDEDVMTAISLYVANNMLDEAFYFEKHFVHHTEGDKFLTHLFNECKKNDKIRSLIYRSLSSVDEEFFLNYLLNTKNSTAEDLHVYYHILRSHYMEAFESHERSVPNHIENQGLIGQETAVPRDKLVHYLKKLLPVVNRNLINLCHKEKNTVWQQVSRPTPMSVFLHNVNENVRYKSTLIGAALAKAKQTFNETVSDKFRLDTEGTPFLRTPTVSSRIKQSPAVVITPKIIGFDKDTDDVQSPPSAKRLKLSPRGKAVTPLPPSIPSKLETPLVKRKLQTATEEKDKVATPHSILKVKSLVNHTPEKGESQFEDDLSAFGKLEYTPVSSKKSGLGLTPRKSLVRFEGLKSSSPSSLETSRHSSSFTEKLNELSKDTSAVNNQRLSGASSKSTSTEEETFYSPETSLEEKQKDEKQDNEINETLLGKNGEVIEKSLNDVKGAFESEAKHSTPLFSPRGRKSYKRSLASTSPIRSSPRLSKNAVTEKESSRPSPRRILEGEELPSLKDTHLNDIKDSVSSSNRSSMNTTESESTSSGRASLSSSLALPKLRPRKSLCRKVLETNTVNRLLQSPRNRRAKSVDNVLERIEIKKSEETVETLRLESNLKYDDGEESRQLSMTKKHNFTSSIVESDLDTSEDFSINYEMAEEPKLLSASMLRYINKSTDKKNVTFETHQNNDVINKKHEEDKSIDTETEKESTAVLEVQQSKDEEKSEEIEVHKDEVVESVLEVKNSEFVQTVSSLDETNETSDSKVPEGESLQNQNLVCEVTTTSIKEPDQSTYSVFESSTEVFSDLSCAESVPKLSESMIRCINNRVYNTEEVDEAKTNEQEEEAMEVDNDDNLNDEDVNIYEDLSEDRDIHRHSEKDVEAECIDLNSSKEDKNEEETKSEEGEEKKEEEKEELLNAEASIERSVDLEMNVFEVTDDLSVNDGLVVEKEVALEENSNDQQNTLNSVLEENTAAVSSTQLNDLEKNVLGEGSCSDEEQESDLNEDSEGRNSSEEGDVKEDEIRSDKSERGDSPEVIEIGSSSEDEEKDKGESSDYDSENSEDNSCKCEETDEEKLDVSYERNIYDTEEDSSGSRSEENRSGEESENSNDSKNSENSGGQLFHGSILLDDDDENQKDDKISKESDKSDKGVDEVKEVVAQDLATEEDKSNQQESSPTDKKEVEPRIFSGYDSFEDTMNEDECKEVDTEKDNEEHDQSKVEPDQLFCGDIVVDEEKEKKSGNEELTPVEITISNDIGGVEEVEFATQTIVENVEEKSEDKENDLEKQVDARDKNDEETVEVHGGEMEVADKVEEREAREDAVNEEMEEQKSEDRNEQEQSVADTNEEEEEEAATRQRTRSASVSSTKSEKTPRKTRQQVLQEPEVVLTPRRSSRLSNKAENEDKPEVAEEPSKSVSRSLRPRRVSTEESSTTPAVKMRKRSASVDEVATRKSNIKEKNAKEVETEQEKTRGQRAASVSRLPIIAEETDDFPVTRKRSKSVLEKYSMNRRVTRQQVHLLKKVVDVIGDNKKINLECLDPTVILERLPSDVLADEEKKVNEELPSPSSSSTTSTPQPTRRGRASSQKSGGSPRSKSKTPVRSVRRSSRKNSSEDNLSTQPNVGTSKKPSKETLPEEATAVVERRTTRSRTRSASFSSVNSEDSFNSNASETRKGGKRKQKITSHSQLPEIKEEPSQSEIPKKRTRRNSSQK